MSIGPVRLKGRGATRPVMFGGAVERLAMHWYERPIDAEADGVISPALLPYDRVRLRFAPPAAAARQTVFRVQLSEHDGLHVPIRVGGAYSIAGRLSLTAPQTVATGAAAALIAETHGGTLSPDGTRVGTGFGIRRPARWLQLSRPVRAGGIEIRQLLMRTGDFLGEHTLPPSRSASPDQEILVMAAGERQEALYRMTLGADVLGQCWEAEYRRATRELITRCR
jgi:hypothetical protein